jgi:GNAT superfamily N-acetyltransferase
MPLLVADWHDILKILHESADLWSAGLSSIDYCRYLQMQMAHPWFKRHVRFLVYQEDGNVKAGCKVHSLPYGSRGKSFPLLGLSAIFTLKAERNKGYAHKLIEKVIALAEKESHHGLVLYSEIADEFYEDFGFEPMGSIEFEIEMTAPNGKTKSPNREETLSPAFQIINKEAQSRFRGYTTKECEPSDAAWMERQYMRWVRREAFGLERTSAYLDFKIRKENFLRQHSQLQWPLLEIHKIDGPDGSGYALTERSKDSMRIFEIVGCEQVRHELWIYLFSLCLEHNLYQVRGWEGLTKDFAPTYKLPPLPQDIAPKLPQSTPLLCAERDWGRCMLLIFNEEISHWLDINPCPMLELDHL